MSDAKATATDGRVIPTGGSGTAPPKEQKEKSTRTANPELQVMAKIDRLLTEELTGDDSRQRVVDWLVGYHGAKPAAPIAPFDTNDPRR